MRRHPTPPIKPLLHTQVFCCIHIQVCIQVFRSTFIFLHSGFCYTHLSLCYTQSFAAHSSLSFAMCSMFATLKPLLQFQAFAPHSCAGDTHIQAYATHSKLCYVHFEASTIHSSFCYGMCFCSKFGSRLKCPFGRGLPIAVHILVW